MNTFKKTNQLLWVAAILQLIWGLVPSASKFVIDEIPVELYISIRWTISGLIFVVYLLATRTWASIALKDAMWVSVLGIFGMALLLSARSTV